MPQRCRLVPTAVRDKVDDYFTRCRLAAFDERAAAALNPADTTYAGLAVQALGTNGSGASFTNVDRLRIRR